MRNSQIRMLHLSRSLMSQSMLCMEHTSQKTATKPWSSHERPLGLSEKTFLQESTLEGLVTRKAAKYKLEISRAKRRLNPYWWGRVRSRSEELMTRANAIWLKSHSSLCLRIFKTVSKFLPHKTRCTMMILTLHSQTQSYTDANFT